MVPTIGLIMTGYIVLRCLEIMVTAKDHWISNGAGIFMRVMAGLTLIVSLVLALGLLGGSTDLPRALP